MKKLIQQIEKYVPWCEQEQADQKAMLDFLLRNPDALSRSNPIAHMSASAWVVNHNRTKVLMAYHNIYQSWSWTGGHADGESNLLSVAIREVKEETGIVTVEPVMDQIYSLEILTVDGHEKRGAYVSSHLHLNVTYLLWANEDEELHIKPDENSQAAWIPITELEKKVSEPWMMQRVYSKLNNKLTHITIN